MLAATVHIVFGQREAKAQAILDKTAAAYQKAGGIAITFGGTQQGTLLLKESCFYLDCAGIKAGSMEKHSGAMHSKTMK